MSDMKSANAELIAELRGLEMQLFPWCKGIAAAFSLAFLVAGLIMGGTIHTSMIAFGNSLFMIGTVLTVVIWDIASTLSLLTGVLDMCLGTQHEVLANTLRQYLHPVHIDPAGPITTVGKLHCQLADVLCRKFHMVLTLLPILAAISALQCLAIGNERNTADGVLVLYWTTAALTILISATGFLMVHYRLRPMVANKLTEWIDPYLSFWLEELEKDNLPASKGRETFSGDVVDLDLEQCAPKTCSKDARVMSLGQRAGGDA